ncbi:MAG: PEP-CTERM system TPR-repeat protein PrsT [Desulfuromonadales bacterium]|nr:PEP-CTERM system TPR-repeat protein PrsT [Desulfuromonadales bacterium]
MATRYWLLLGLAACLGGCTGSSKESLLGEGVDLYQQKNYRGAIVLFKSALDKDPSFYRARFFLADAYLQAGRFDLAEREFKKVALQAPDYPGMPLKLAELYNQLNRPEEAAAEAGSYLQNHPGDPQALRLLGTARALQADLPEAERNFRQALEAEPENSEVQLALADCLSRSERREEARELLKKILARDDRHIPAHLELARLENDLGNQEQALQIYRRVTVLDPGNAQVLYLTGLLLLEKNDAEGAEALAKELSSRFKESPRGTQLQGYVHFQRRQFEEAAVCLQTTAETQPDLLTYYLLGMTYYQLGKLELAVNQFQRLLDYRPQAVGPRVALATVLLRQQRVDDAVAELQRAIQINDRHPQAHNALANAYLAQGHFEKAAFEFDRAIRLAPDQIGPRLSKGVASLARGDVAAGEAALVEALAIAPETADVRLLLAGHYLREKKFDNALTTLQAGLTGEPSDALIYNYLAAAHFGRNQPAQAIASLEKAKALQPDYLLPYFNLAAYFLTRGEYAKAAEQYQTLLERHPNDLRALISLGQVAQLEGKSVEAETFYRKAGQSGQLAGLLGWADYLHRQGRSAEALAFLSEAGGKEPTLAQIPELKGRILQSQGKYVEAIAAFAQCEKLAPGQGLPLLVGAYLVQGESEKAETVSRQMIARHPKHPAGYLAQSLVLEKLGRPREAIDLLQDLPGEVGRSVPVRMRIAELEEKTLHLERSLELYESIGRDHPSYYPALFAAGSVWDRLGSKERALSLYRQVLEQKEDFAPALNNLAYLYAAEDENRQEALSLALRANLAQPGNPWILDTLGLTYLRSGRLTEARQVLEQAIKLLPQEPTVNYHLALVYHRLGEEERSTRALRDAIGLGTFPEVAEAQALLAKLTGKIGGGI